jgi:hypothetical protein
VAVAAAALAAGVSAVPPYSYYRSMLSRYHGGGPGSMMGGGYGWMFGGAGAPAWMRGAQLPAAVLGTGTDMGHIMGRLWADGPGQHVSPGDAIRMADQVPPARPSARPPTRSRSPAATSP